MTKNTFLQKVLIIGAGLAGSDAAYFLAEKGIQVVLFEGKSENNNPSQKLKTAAELVCTNSLKSMDPYSGHGLLKYEMEKLGSLVLKAAKEHAVPAGSALAVDREKFSQSIHETLKNHPNIEFIEKEVSDPIKTAEEYNCNYTIVATGPLTSKSMEEWILKSISGEDFYFYDAIAPVVDADSLDISKMYFKDRHVEIKEEEVDSADYLNIALNEDEYYRFVGELVRAEKVPPAKFEEEKFFEACLPIDIMAERGKETARFSCMKPIGLENKDGETAFAVVQLRKENLLGSAFNLVGFQTRLTYKEQLRVFKMLPGMENASFIHLGSVHRNSFLNSKKLLGHDLSSKEFPKLHFAGQMTGVEGYTESASMGLYVASQIYRKIKGLEASTWPTETGIGALVNYIMTVQKPTPSNINFGLLPSVPFSRKISGGLPKKKYKKMIASKRANEAFDTFWTENGVTLS
jgi:methylenetetrahydrofolate--tRNA-(uracil-5-)-methyltransferase